MLRGKQFPQLTTMAQRVTNTVYHFRDTFRVVNKEALHWFPGHMGKGLKQMQQKLKLVDCVVEVHDARIPLSGRNPNFKHTVLGVKPHVLVMNKKDLSDMSMQNEVEESLRKEGNNHIFFTNAKDRKCNGMRKLIPTVVDLIASSDRYNRSEEQDYCIMIIGVPNVGKSSVINALRHKHLGKAKAAAVGGVAGVTRSVQNRIKVSDKPLIYLMDTPGILAPNVQDIETGLRLALCATLQDHLVGEEIIADYLLYWLNKHDNFKYVPIMGLEEPTDNIGTVLTKCAAKLGKSQRIRDVISGSYMQRLDLSLAARYFISTFRSGELGKIMLDIDKIASRQYPYSRQ